jgi:hypothetical protein
MVNFDREKYRPLPNGEIYNGKFYNAENTVKLEIYNDEF